MCLLALALLVQDPATTAPPVEAEPSSQATAPSISDEDIRVFAALQGRKVAGRPVGGLYPTADKILLIGLDGKGYLTITASMALPVRESLPPPPEGALAIVRLHQQPSPVVPGPTPDDLAFAAANKIPLFVIGEWARPAPMWEVAWVDGAVRYRTIGDIGEIGPWQD